MKIWMSVCRFLIYVTFNVAIFVLADCCVQKVDMAFRYLLRKIYRRYCIVEVVYEFCKTVCTYLLSESKYVLNKPCPVQ